MSLTIGSLFAGLAGERSGLWYEFARIVGEMGPRFVVVENVPALLDRGMGDVLGTLSDLGYDAEWSTISACSVGAPHMRQRVFICAHANSERFQGWQDCCGGSSSRSGAEQQLPRLLPPSPWTDLSRPQPHGVAHGLPDRSQRTHALGNAVVPQVAEVVGRVVLALEHSRNASFTPSASQGEPR